MPEFELLVREKSETAHQYAFRVIQYNILHLNLAPGQLISESEIGEKLHMSRTPIREAFKDLSKARIVQIEPQRGTFVSEIDSKLVSDACFLRLTIERAVISIACKGISPDYISQLEENLFLSSYYISRGEIDKWFQQDDAFHQLIFAACGKEQIYRLFDDVMLHFNRVRIMNLKEVNMSLAHKEHLELLDAVKKCDEKLALEILERHLTYCVTHCI